MKIVLRKNFIVEVSKIKSLEKLNEIEFILESAFLVSDASELPEFKKLTGYYGYARIKTGDYRIGIKYSKGYIEFITVLHRSIIYERFP